MEHFIVEKVNNGFKVLAVSNIENGMRQEDEFVFESPAKLRKAVKFFLDKLTQKGE